MLDEAGFDFSKPDPKLAWEVFKRFVREPVECADDGILFECGVFGSDDSPFTMDFVRQFSYEVDGHYSHMEQLRCGFGCPATSELKNLKKNLWAYDYKTLEEYFAAVENLPEFQIAMSQSKADWTCEVGLEGV